MVGLWHKYGQGPKPLLVARSLAPVTCAHGMRVLPDVDLAGAGTLTQLLVPGGFAAFDEMKLPDITGFVRRHFDAGADVMSVCSGTFILQAAGVLQGRRASTNWKVLKMLRDTGVDVVEERYTHDGPLWTSAGVSAGMDMLLAYIAHTQGEEMASQTQLNAEYYPEGRIYGSAHNAQPVPAYIRRA
jgi:transcriptional regulator GlxA family with amidase domain